jgi:hypothetical protein
LDSLASFRSLDFLSAKHSGYRSEAAQSNLGGPDRFFQASFSFQALSDESFQNPTAIYV